jgi:hypothetical protein
MGLITKKERRNSHDKVPLRRSRPLKMQKASVIYLLYWRWLIGHLATWSICKIFSCNVRFCGYYAKLRKFEIFANLQTCSYVSKKAKWAKLFEFSFGFLKNTIFVSTISCLQDLSVDVSCSTRSELSIKTKPRNSNGLSKPRLAYTPSK